MLASELCASGYDVRFIEKDLHKSEKLLDDLPPGIIVINGDPTDEEVMDEAGIKEADAFIGTAQDDEDNILSCIMAKRLGAKKTVTVTYKPEYIRIVPTMDMIDCGFSATLVSVNSILKLTRDRHHALDAFLL
jgi:trk system potassium uptake protein TrkA